MPCKANLPKVRGAYKFNIDIGGISWFGLRTIAQTLFKPHDTDDLQYFLSQMGINSPNLPIVVIGGGSNILFRKSFFPGIVIKLGRHFNFLRHDDSRIIIGANVLDSTAAIYTMNNSLSNLEFLYTIPGTIGGGIAMNAGSYGSEISDIFVSCEAVHRNSGELRSFKLGDMNYKYRHTSISNDWIFTSACFSCIKSDRDDIENLMSRMKSQKAITQPVSEKTSGSTFKNPEDCEMKAWELIDASGLRGFRIGGARISEKHCNFFINEDSANTDDMIELIEHTQNQVWKKHSVALETEVKIY